MKYLFLLLVFFTWMFESAYAQFYTGSSRAVNLYNIVQMADGRQWISGASDPTIVAVNAPAGSYYTRSNGVMYIKQDAGSSTNWSALAFTSGLGAYVLKAGDTMTGALVNQVSFGLRETGGGGDIGSIVAPSSYGANRTHTLPDGSGTLLDTSTYAQVSNKDMNEDSVTIAKSGFGYVEFDNDGSSGNSRALLQFANSAGRTYIFPNNSGTVALTSDITGLYCLLTGCTLTGPFTVDGSTNAVQQIIQANATQTANLIEHQSSASAFLSGFDSGGDLLFPDSSSSASDPDVSWITGSNRSGIGYNSAGVNSELFFSTNNSSRMSIGLAGMLVNVKAFLNGGTSVALAMASSDGDTGLNYVTTDSFALTTGGTNRVTVSNSTTTISNNLAVTGSTTLATSLTGPLKAASGVVSASAINLASEVTGVLPLANGGTNKNLTASNGAVPYSDADSFELLSPGTAGQILQTNGAGVAPTFVNKSISGKAQSVAAVTVEEIQVPANQLTSTASNKHLIETGNGNVLQNPGFEHSTIATGWTIANGTGGSTASTPFGAAAITVTAAAQTSTLTSSTAGAAYSGLNCLASAWVKTALSNVQVCPEINGAVTSSLCVNVNSIDTWGIYQIPIVCGSTSTAVKVQMSSSGTGSFAVDEAYVGVNKNISSVSQNTLWESYTPTFTGFGTASSIDCKKKRDGGDLLVDCKFTSGTSTGTEARISLPTGLTSAAAISSIRQAGVYFNSVSGGSTFKGGAVLIEPSVTYFTIGSAGTFNNNSLDTLEKATGSGSNIASGNIVSFLARVPIQEWQSTTPVISTTNLDYDWTAYTPTITGFGTAASVTFYHKRVGSDLLIRGRFTSGTPTATEARVSLPSGLTSSSTITTLEVAGAMATNDPSTVYGFTPYREPSTTYFVMGYKSSGVEELVKKNGNAMAVAGNVLSFEVRVPIQGWISNNVIIGTFSNGDVANVAYTPSTQGFGTVSAMSCWYSYSGGQKKLYVNCKFTTGTPTATEARVNLPAGYTISNDSGKINSFQDCGLARSWAASAVDVWQFAIIQKNVTYINFTYINGSTASLVQRNGNDVVGSSTDFTFSCEIPID